MAFIAGFVIGSMLGVTVAVPRVIVADPATDCATGFCTCGNCGGSINPYAAYCEHCGARMEDE